MDFDEWLTARLPRLLRLATALCGGPDPAEDLLQEVVIKVHRRWPGFLDLEHPDAYLRRMVVNEHLSWRRRFARPLPPAVLHDRTDATAYGHQHVDQHADRSELAAELAKLPPRQRTALVLHYLEGLTDVEIGAAMGCRPGTVRSHLSRGLAALRIEMSVPAPKSDEENVRAH